MSKDKTNNVVEEKKIVSSITQPVLIVHQKLSTFKDTLPNFSHEYIYMYSISYNPIRRTILICIVFVSRNIWWKIIKKRV